MENVYNLFQDECSFVSLRDVERVLKVMSWFYQQSQDNRILFNLMEHEETQEHDEREDTDEEEEEEEEDTLVSSKEGLSVFCLVFFINILQL